MPPVPPATEGSRWSGRTTRCRPRVAKSGGRGGCLREQRPSANTPANDTTVPDSCRWTRHGPPYPVTASSSARSSATSREPTRRWAPTTSKIDWTGSEAPESRAGAPRREHPLGRRRRSSLGRAVRFATPLRSARACRGCGEPCRVEEAQAAGAASADPVRARPRATRRRRTAPAPHSGRPRPSARSRRGSRPDPRVGLAPDGAPEPSGTNEPAPVACARLLRRPPRSPPGATRERLPDMLDYGRR